MYPVNRDDERAFLEEFARSIISWQYVEVEVFFLFNRLAGDGADRRCVSETFYSEQNLHGRLKKLTRSLDAAAPTLKDEWEEVRREIAETAKKRNALAHFMVVGHTKVDGTHGLLLSPSIYDARWGLEDRTEYGLEDIKAFGVAFLALAQKVHELSDRVLAVRAGNR